MYVFLLNSKNKATNIKSEIEVVLRYSEFKVLIDDDAVIEIIISDRDDFVALRCPLNMFLLCGPILYFTHRC